MGNHPSAARDSPSPSSSSSHSTSRDPLARRAQVQAHHQRHSNSQRSSLHSASGPSTSASSHSPANSYDYTLSPSTSLSPSVTRVETHYHHSHQHGVSLDSYLASQSSEAPGAMGAASSSEKLPKPRPTNRDRNEATTPRTTPVSVPIRQKSLRQREATSKPEPPPFKPSHPPRDIDATPYALPQPAFHHPPRLPLPIGQEELAPGSPVLTAADLDSHVPAIGSEDALDGNRLILSKSTLSQTTADDEDESVGDIAELDTVTPDVKGRTVPVEVTWIDGGDKVYVTGTFANWSKKFRMHRDPEDGYAKTTLDLLPGMHHIRYIVDGEMRLREDKDQAVDYTNTLVNIIEVPAEPVFHRAMTADGGTDSPSQEAPRNDFGHSPNDAPPAVDVHDHDPNAQPADAVSQDSKKQLTLELMELPPIHYGHMVPGYLLDLDRDEKSARFARASSRVTEIPPPPTLPGFLSKSILNGTVPIKDDSSILNMPNHTVLNHLTTSSIRQGVLATSLTTRYKRKFVTLITYRPTSTED